MTREEHLYSMRMQELVGVAEKLGIKINTKAAKSAAIEKILAAEELKIEEPTISDEELAEINQAVSDFIEEPKLVPMPGSEKLADLKKEVSKPERKRGVKIEYNGKTQNICAWAKELGVSANTLYSRIYILGWDVEKAFTHRGKKS